MIEKSLSGKSSQLFLALALGILVILSSGCASTRATAGRPRLKELRLAPLSEMPDYVRSASPQAQEAYRFAVANPELLKHIPCYCGCNAIGHQNNFDCYVDALDPVVEFDNHAAY